MSDEISVDTIVEAFFSIFTNKGGRRPDWDAILSVCISEAIIIKKTGLTEDIYSLSSFIEPRRKILSDGTLTEFEERETESETNILGNMAQRFSMYQKAGYLNGVYFTGDGIKLFQLIRTVEGWKISSVVWEDH